MELQSNLEMARAVSESFSHSVQEIVRQEQMIGSVFTESRPPLSEEIRPLFDGFKHNYGSFQNLVWINPRGIVLGSSDPALIGTDVSSQPYFKEIAEGRDWSISQLFRSKNGKVAFAVGSGVRKNGVLVCVVAANVDANELENLSREPWRNYNGAQCAWERFRLLYTSAGERGKIGRPVKSRLVLEDIRGAQPDPAPID